MYDELKIIVNINGNFFLRKTTDLTGSSLIWFIFVYKQGGISDHNVLYPLN